MLAKLEDDAQFAFDTAKRKMDRRDSDANKEAYYNMKAAYEFLSAELGANSPAKLAGKARKVKAAAEAALIELADSLQKAQNLKDVVKFIEKASKGTSPLPALLKEARTDDTMLSVLQLVADNKKMAKLLATQLLAATTEEQAAVAFALIKEAAVTEGTDDPEVIMRAKLDSLVSKYVMSGEMAMAKIKDAFNRAAEGATTEADLGNALMTAANAAESKRTEIEAALTEAVAPLAGAYDLTDARDRITTALAAGRAEVRLQHARQGAKLQARDFETSLNEALAEAGNDADVEALLESAHSFSAEAGAALDEQL